MAENNESFFVKIGVLWDKTGAKMATVGMLDIKKSAEGIYDSFKRIVDVNSDLYRTSQLLNVGTDDLQKWQRVFKLVGGSAEDARSTISNLNFVFDKLRLGMDGEKASIGARLGLTPEDFTNVETMLKGLNRSFNEVFKGDRGTFTPLAQQLGLNNTALLLVTQSTKEYENSLKRANSVPLIGNADLRRLDNVRKSMVMINEQFSIFGSKLVAGNSKEIEKFFSSLEKVISNPENIKAMNDLFKAVSAGFSKLATDENIKFVIGALAKISELVLKGAGETIKGVRMTAEAFSSDDVSSAFGADVLSNKALQIGSDVLSNPVINPVGFLKDTYNNTITNYFNISNPNPKEVAQQVIDKQQQQQRDVNKSNNARNY